MIISNILSTSSRDGLQCGPAMFPFSWFHHQSRLQANFAAQGAGTGPDRNKASWLTRSLLSLIITSPVPFFSVPLIGLAILRPGVQLARSIKLPGQRLTPAQFGISAAVVCATAVVAATIGLWVARRLLAWRTTNLGAYLADTEKG
jgi:hypothetical protein